MGFGNADKGTLYINGLAIGEVKEFNFTFEYDNRTVEVEATDLSTGRKIKGEVI